MSNYLVIGKKPTYHSIADDVVDVTLACAETLSVVPHFGYFEH